jgi:hypothetical protein
MKNNMKISLQEKWKDILGKAVAFSLIKTQTTVFKIIKSIANIYLLKEK